MVERQQSNSMYAGGWMWGTLATGSYSQAFKRPKSHPCFPGAVDGAASTDHEMPCPTGPTEDRARVLPLDHEYQSYRSFTPVYKGFPVGCHWHIRSGCRLSPCSYYAVGYVICSLSCCLLCHALMSCHMLVHAWRGWAREDSAI